eukprot:TRINITY_DN18871_c0_g1_i3.p1 TRINITY_DN18871_c0_g1~~TRINITY_DN18871_c0_g1_i3.p1  ORF type:complete len:799 (-),score=175.84 TRINITY_DN18871_c0_g1_i3:77-2473(-)
MATALSAGNGGDEDLLQDVDGFFDKLLADAGLAGVDSPAAAAPAPAASGAGSNGGSDGKAAVTAATGASSAEPRPAPSPANSDEDVEYAQLEQQVRKGGDRRSPTGIAADRSEIAASALLGGYRGSSDDGGQPPVASPASSSSPNSPQDYDPLLSVLSEPPRAAAAQAPPPPANETAQDRLLREALVDFYECYNPANLPNVQQIVEGYRGPLVSHLWAQLANKYNVAPGEAVHLLARTLYFDEAFEHSDQASADRLDELLESAKEAAGDGDAADTSSGLSSKEKVSRAMQTSIESGSHEMLRALCFRGCPDDGESRAMIWRVLLGCLPIARHSEWNAIAGEKRALYAGYKRDLLIVSDDFTVSATKEAPGRAEDFGADGTRTIMGPEKVLQEIRMDVARTRLQCDDHFRRPRNVTEASLVAILFVYARLNPGVRYTQGMNEVAAIIFYVMTSGAPEQQDNTEADAFWCFSEIMSELKEGFMQVFDNTAVGVHASAANVMRLVRSYDPSVAAHMEEHEFPLHIWAFRWCSLLFAQDFSLPDVVRLWDSFIGDPQRFQFVGYLAFAAIFLGRSGLLAADTQFEMAEVFQRLTGRLDIKTMHRIACAVCAFERRPQTPEFPRGSAFKDISELAQTAAVKAQEVQAVVKKSIQEDIAPIVQERAGKAAVVVASAAHDGAQAVQSWLEDTAPARTEALVKAHTQLSNIWGAVRSRGQAIATTAEREGAAAALSSTAGDSAATAASAVSKGAALAAKWWGGAAASPGGAAATSSGLHLGPIGESDASANSGSAAGVGVINRPAV